MNKKIFLIHGEAIFRLGICKIIHDVNPGILISEEESFVYYSIKELNKFDVIILEDSDRLDAKEALEGILRPVNAKIVVISSSTNKRNLKCFLRLGIFGYLLKKSSGQELHNTLKSVLDNQKHFCPFVMETLISEENKPESAATPLTERELEITRLVVSGYRTSEIAERLNLSHHTIQTHRKNINRKTGVRSALELTFYMKNNGLS